MPVPSETFFPETVTTAPTASICESRGLPWVMLMTLAAWEVTGRPRKRSEMMRKVVDLKYFPIISNNLVKV